MKITVEVDTHSATLVGVFILAVAGAAALIFGLGSIVRDLRGLSHTECVAVQDIGTLCPILRYGSGLWLMMLALILLVLSVGTYAYDAGKLDAKESKKKGKKL